MDRPVLGQLTLMGSPLRFDCPSEDGPAISSLLTHWQVYLNTTGIADTLNLDRTADIHRQVVQFMASVGSAASSAVVHPVVSKCREHFTYFVGKSREHGTELATWEKGVVFARPSSDAQRVITDVVRETIDHLLNFAKDNAAARTTAIAVQPSSSSGPVPFIVSEDDSRKPRGYYYYGNELAMVETHFDAHLLLDLCDLSLTPGILKTGWWEPWIDILLRSTLQPGMTYVNAGANIGYHTTLAGKLVDSYGKVFSFEANPHAYSLLRKSVYFNGFSGRTTLFPAAVFDRPGKMKFHYVREMLGGGGLYHRPAKLHYVRRMLGAGWLYDRAVTKKLREPDILHPLRERFLYGRHSFIRASVPVVTIDEALAPEAETIDFLHMDIEGSEGPALLGAQGLIQRSRQLQIIIEWSYQGIVSASVREKLKQAVALLAADRFKFYVITPPRGNAYANPPDLRRVDLPELFELGHSDIYLTRG